MTATSVANYDAHHHANDDANYAANFRASSHASTGAIRLQTSMPIILPPSIAQVDAN